MQIAKTFGIDIDKDAVRHVLAKHYRPLPKDSGPSWLAFIGHIKDSLWSVDLGLYPFSPPGHCGKART